MNSFLEFKHQFDAAGAARGQIVLEYFVLFAVLALLTLASVRVFGGNIKTSLTDFFSAAAEKVATSEVPQVGGGNGGGGPRPPRPCRPQPGCED